MNFFTAPRGRPIIYNPQVDKATMFNRTDMRSGRLAGLGQTALGVAQRLVSDNIPAIGRIRDAITGSQKYIMPGVQSVKWVYAREVSEQYGLQYYTLLPWYTKAVVVSVTGKYYMGAFTQDTVVSLASQLLRMDKNLLAWIRKELSGLDSRLTNYNLLSAAEIQDPTRSQQTVEDKDLFSSLTIGTPNDPDSMTLLGFIRKFQITESVESPFVQAYEMDYIGVDQAWYNAATAEVKVYQDDPSRK